MLTLCVHSEIVPYLQKQPVGHFGMFKKRNSRSSNKIYIVLFRVKITLYNLALLGALNLLGSQLQLKYSITILKYYESSNTMIIKNLHCSQLSNIYILYCSS